MNGQAWTKEEEAHLKRWYGIHKPSRIAHDLGRSKFSIYQKAIKLELTAQHLGWEKGRERGETKSKLDLVEYNPELNAPDRNWEALFVFFYRSLIDKPITVNKALESVGLNAHLAIFPDEEVQ